MAANKKIGPILDLGHTFIDNGGIEDVSQKRNAKPKRPLSSGKIE
jgi:hypothetical protein